MKKVCAWLAIFSVIVFLIAWGIVSVKLLDGNYVFTTEIYIAAVSFTISHAAIVGYKMVGIRCPHCGKINDSLFGKGKFCPHCGKSLEIKNKKDK